MKSFSLLLIFALASSGYAQSNVPVKGTKASKSFSIFSVVQFGNSQCVSTTSTSTSTVQGTCYTTSECTANGGTASGSCASGFGVCCVITVSACGSTISKNITYIQNPGFPSGTTSTTSCSYTLSSTSDICQLRLDFDNFVTANPGTAVGGTAGGCNAGDRLTITSSSGSGPNASPPVTCGTLTGSHMYIETGRSAPTGATLAILNAAVTSPARTWKIKVTQIECGSASKAPTDCLQYYTGVAGNFKSFNYQGGTATGQFLQSQNFQVCIRQEEGFCNIQYRQNDATTTPGFQLGAGGVAGRTCTIAVVTIPSISAGLPAGVSQAETFCGGKFSTMMADTKSGVVVGNISPFNVGVFTTSDAQTSAIGFNLQYTQIPC